MLSLTLYIWYQYCLDIKTQKAAKKREQWESEHPRINERHGRRQKRSISVEHHVETLVVVDPDMTEYYKNEDVTNYVLTIMNMVCFKNVLPFHQILDGHLSLNENDKLTNTSDFILLYASWFLLHIQVSNLFHDASLGNAVNIVVVRIILLEDEQVRIYFLN